MYLQTFIQMRTTKSEEIRQKIDLKKDVIETWMKENNVPDDMKKEIMKNINKKLEEDKDADLENLFNVLPGYMKNSLKHHLCFKILSQVCFSTSLSHSLKYLYVYYFLKKKILTT